MKTVTSSVAFQGPDGTVAANGRLLLSLSQNALITSGGGQVYSNLPVVIDLDANGKIPANTQIWANDELTPSGTTYLANLQDKFGTRLDTLGTWSIAGASPIDLSLMVPTSSAISFPNPVLLGPAGNQTVVQPTGTSLFVNRFENIRFADQFATGSSTGGIQEAINDIGSGVGEVWVNANVTATVAINMVANVDVHGVGKSVTVTFSGATDGFVWPSTAAFAGLYDLTLQAGNAACGKAVNISDATAAAIGVVIEGVKITSSNAPTTKWAYGFYFSNAIFETINTCYVQTATIAVHTDGTTNATYFNHLNTNSNIGGLTTCLELQGGDVHFVNGDIEGQYSNALAEITQPGAAGTHIFFVNTRFENHTATGMCIHCNTGRFEAYGCLLSIDGGATAIGFVIGDNAQTNDCKVIGGEGIGWTLGANATGNLVTGYTWDNAITPVNNSVAGTNNLFFNHATGAGSTFAAGSFVEPIREKDGSVSIPAYSFLSETGAGFYRAGTNNIGLAFAGTEFVRFSNFVRQGSGGVFSWSATDSTAVADTAYSRISPAVSAIGNGTVGDKSGTIQLATVQQITANGGQWIKGQASELLTLSTSGTTTDTSATLLPANSIIEAVVARVTTTITVATDWKLGDATISGRFSAADAVMTAGETVVGTVQADQTGTSGPRQVAAAKVRVTTTGTPGAGVIRITVFYRQFVAPTS